MFKKDPPEKGGFFPLSFMAHNLTPKEQQLKQELDNCVQSIKDLQQTIDCTTDMDNKFELVGQIDRLRMRRDTLLFLLE
jgi:hypothetical protein